MKNTNGMIYTWAVSVVVLCLNTFALASSPNLVPAKPAQSPNYWCTWYAQNYWIGRGTDFTNLKSITNSNAREELTEETVFNPKDGWATTYLNHGRGDYIFLIDHGWQSKNKAEWTGGGRMFFNLIVDPQDFPKYAHLEPKDRLRMFNEDIKSLGWNSLGLWVRGAVTLEDAETFVSWCKYAGIRYWKIDGGDTDAFHAVQATEKLYPDLILEYVTGAGGNINPKWDQDLVSYPSPYRPAGNRQTHMIKISQRADTFRTYDVAPLLMSVTTLRRAHDILQQTQQQPKYRAILNVQDDCNIAVGLGVSVASKRHPNMNERTYRGKDLHHQLSGKRCIQKRINEVERFGRWARIAPAFPCGEGIYLSSDNELIDRCRFTEWDTWNKATYGKIVSQSAPAIMARNMPLPRVEVEGKPPYVCATTYPNGPLGIATEGRVSEEDHWFHPRAKISVKVKDANQPIGIVGYYKQLDLEFAGSLDAVKHVWAQDLLADEAKDIKDSVLIKGNRLSIPGALIDYVGTSSGDQEDKSVPGLVLQLEGNSLPIAGNEFMTNTKVVSDGPAMREQNDVYKGTAHVTPSRYGYHVQSGDGPRISLKRLDRAIYTGTATITWKMNPADEIEASNGFLVLSGDEDAAVSVLAGVWNASSEITAFENDGIWAGRTKVFGAGGEMECRLDIDMDTRTLRLSVNDSQINYAFSENLTSIHYIGFGVRDASMLFSEPKITTR